MEDRAGIGGEMRFPSLSRQEPREAEGVLATITTVRVRGFLLSPPHYAL